MYLAENTLLQGGKYKIARHISSGGFGNTYEGIHTMMDNRVAIKEFFVKDFCDRDEETSNVTVVTKSKKDLVEKLRMKFIEEAKAIFKMKHPNIVHVLDIFEENGTSYYVMDYIDGPSLNDIIKKSGAMPEAKALKYMLQVCDALKYVHSLNRLHLDIKPGNIMIDENDNAILIDFGASKHYSSETGENTTTMQGLNTSGYAPIEQTVDGITTFTPASDIYAVGATLYKLLTGATPISSSLRASGEELMPLYSHISDNVRDAVMKAMSINKRNRPQSIDEFVELVGRSAESVYSSSKMNRDKIREEEEKERQRLEEEKKKEEEKEQIRVQIKEKEDIISSKKEEIANNNNDKTAEEKRIVELESQIEDCRSKIKKIVDVNTEIDNEISILASAIKSLNSQLSRLDKPIHEIEETVVLGAPVNMYDEFLKFSVKGVEFTMKLVKAGSYMMGATSIQESYSSILEKPVHKVNLTKDYYIGETLVTQALWKAIMGNNPSRFGGDMRPVERVSFISCREFISKLNQELNTSFRLPTEAEWEYAARDGGMSDLLYPGSNDMTAVAWTSSDAKMTYPVKEKNPNKLGIYDMCGNVSEWCSDNFYRYSSGEVTDPTNEKGELSHIIRGGSWRFLPLYCRISSRDYEAGDKEMDNIGLRLVLPVN